jgi:hypothetical protein
MGAGTMMQQQAITQPKQRGIGDRFQQYPNSLTVPIDIVGSTNFGRYPKIATEQTYNMIISDGAMVDFAGYEVVAMIGGNTAREVYNSVLLNSIVAVIDNRVFVIDTGYSVNQVGTLATTTGNVFISDNFASQIAIVDGINVYMYNYLNNTFQTVLVDFSPGYITYQDTFFIAADIATNQWRLSEPNDGTMWPDQAQNVGELQSKPCRMVATVALDRILLVMGQTVTEPWYDAGLQLFPYQRNDYYCIDYGCASAETIASGYGMIVWLATNQQSGYQIMVSQEGGPPQTIDFDGLDFFFSQLTMPQNSFGMLFKMDGHIFYMITFTTDNRTYLFDFNTQMFFSLCDENYNHHIARRIVFFNNSYHFISFTDSNLYKMNSQITNYNGAMIPRIRICKNIRFPGADRFIIQNINITMESGLNQGATKIEFAASTDGGYSYDYFIPFVMPSLGQRQNAVNLYNLGGIENDFVPRFQFWAKGRFVINGGTISLYR